MVISVLRQGPINHLKNFSKKVEFVISYSKARAKLEGGLYFQRVTPGHPIRRRFFRQ